LLQRRRKQAAFRDADRTLDNFDFTFNPKMNRSPARVNEFETLRGGI
jgi:hypothetical protein